MDAQHEPVQLRLGQRVGALLLDGVLRGHHDEGRRQRVGLAVDGHRQFLHRLEQRRLGFGRRAVDFVGQDEVGENGAAVKDQVAAPAALVALENLRAGDVRGHEVGRELDAPESQPSRSASALTIMVLASPGTPITSTCPPDIRPVSSSRTTSFCPMSTLPICACRSRQQSRSRDTPASATLS